MNVTVAELGLAPGKSMRAQEIVEELVVDERGLFDDREYMWVEAEPHEHVTYKIGQIAEPGQFLSQREDPILTQIIPEIGTEGVNLQFGESSGNSLWLPKAEDEPENRIPVSIRSWKGEAVDQGDIVAECGTDFIGRPVRLVAVSDYSPRYVEGNYRLGRVGFADGFPLLVASVASVEKVNEWLEEAGKPNVPADRFRANILLDGIEAFQEDFIESITVASDGLKMVLKRAKPCGRCPIPDTNQQTGEVRTDVRFVLGKRGRRGVYTDIQKYGNGKEIFFGQNFVIELPKNLPEYGTVPIRQGDQLEATFSDFTNWQAA